MTYVHNWEGFSASPKPTLMEMIKLGRASVSVFQITHLHGFIGEDINIKRKLIEMGKPQTENAIAISFSVIK